MGVELFDELGFTVSRGGQQILTVETDSGTHTDAETTFGNIKKFIHKPRVNADVAPVSQKLRRLPLSVRDEVSKELNQLKEMGIIELIDSSPWISNIVVARRKSGAICICVGPEGCQQSNHPRQVSTAYSRRGICRISQFHCVFETGPATSLSPGSAS